MFREMLLVVWIAHLIGDFVLQTDRIAAEKDRKAEAMAVHGVLYALPFAAVAFLYGGRASFLGTCAALALTHLAIDVSKRWWRTRQPWTYLLDQCLHVLSLFSAAYALSLADPAPHPMKVFSTMLARMQVPGRESGAILFCVLALGTPCNILIRLICHGKPIQARTELGAEEQRTGRVIGILERMVLLACLWKGEYTALGFVLTAKSIARFDQIANDRAFAEYYLVGTLLSTLCALTVVAVGKWLAG